MITTVIIDIQKKDRDRITSLLSTQKDIKVLAHGKDGYDALKLTGSLKPDIAILDNHLEFIEGQEIPPLLRARSPATAVVILTSKISDYQLYRAASNEVSGFVHKETDIDTFPWILKCISEGRCFISPVFAGRVLNLLSLMNRKKNDMRPGPERPQVRHKNTREKIQPREDPAGYLSKTELMVLSRIGEGYTSTEIAQDMNLAIGTVRNYISFVMRKTGVRNRSQMVRYALSHGLIPLNAANNRC